MLLLDEKKIMADSLEHGTMKFVEFVKFNNIDLDSIFVDKFFHNIQNNMPIYMNKDMIGYFGYSGLMKAQRKRLCELIETNFIDYQDKLWWDFKNKDYIEYRKSLLGQANHKKIDESVDLELLYPPAPTGQGKSNTKHLLVSPKLFKGMLMMCQTSKCKRIRRYYVDIEETIMLYVRYQCLLENTNPNKRIYDLFSKQYTQQLNILEFDKKIQKKYKLGCVYYIQEKETNNVKIGWCWYLPKRLQCLQIGNSKKLIVVKIEITQFPYEREQYLHHLYKNSHIRGEWYKINMHKIK